MPNPSFVEEGEEAQRERAELAFFSFLSCEQGFIAYAGSELVIFLTRPA